MIYYTNECCDCAVDGYPCLGDLCSLRHTPHYVCDECGKEYNDPDKLGINEDDYQVCLDCMER